MINVKYGLLLIIICSTLLGCETFKGGYVISEYKVIKCEPLSNVDFKANDKDSRYILKSTKSKLCKSFEYFEKNKSMVDREEIPILFNRNNKCTLNVFNPFSYRVGMFSKEYWPCVDPKSRSCNTLKTSAASENRKFAEYYLTKKGLKIKSVNMHDVIKREIFLEKYCKHLN